MKTYNINVNTKDKKYKIFIGSNIINNISKYLHKEKISFEKCLVVLDKNIPLKFKTYILKELNSKKVIYSFKSNEKNKNFKNVDKIHKILFKNKFNRNDCIISFGGGITGDVVGFAASTYKRGIKYINIPSTLLSQVDSSIGGKTGINNSFGKNLIGSFYQPDLVISDIKLLNSLPKREIICGYAEILKSSLIDSKNKFNFLNKNLNKILELKSPFIEKAIISSCKLKKKVIEIDEKEKSYRKVLNLGHTFAHAYETTLKYSKKLNHGEAVIIGLENMINFSNYIKLLNGKNHNLIINHINKIGLKSKFKKLLNIKHLNKIIMHMGLDKKNNSKKINLILIKNFGKIKTDFQIDPSKLKRFIKSELNK